MNPDRHMSSHYDYFLDLIRGDDDSAESHRQFYDEYNAVLDMPAEYYLDTIKTVFQDFALVNGTWHVKGQLVRPQDITTTALLTIEGELDDISGAGQTAPRTTCAPASRRRASSTTTWQGAGHYGIFSGRRWRERSTPRSRGLHRAQRAAAPPRPKGAAKKAPPRREVSAWCRRPARAFTRRGADAIDAAAAADAVHALRLPDCRGYAEAIASGEAAINRCPPGGAEGIVRLAALTGRPALPLDAACGTKARARWPSSTRPGASAARCASRPARSTASSVRPRRMHTVIDEQCTGCELCVPACPVDCIAMVPVTGERTGWQAWSARQAAAARERYAFHRLRVERDRARTTNAWPPRPGQAGRPAAHSQHTDPAVPSSASAR
jgi:RnfABCDGE-type electron transport complex B subunit